MPPGTLVHIGEKKTAASHVILMDYDESSVRELEVSAAELSNKIKLIQESARTIWINLNGLGDIAMMEQIGACFKLHPLVLEDIFNTEQRSKLEDYGDYLYVVLKTFGYENSGSAERLSSDQVSLVVGIGLVALN